MVIRNYNVIADTIDSIKKHSPDVYNIYIKNQAINPRGFRCIIELRLHGKKIVASKGAESYRKALARTEEAILKQLQKEKDRSKKFMRPKEKHLWDNQWSQDFQSLAVG